MGPPCGHLHKVCPPQFAGALVEFEEPAYLSGDADQVPFLLVLQGASFEGLACSVSWSALTKIQNEGFSLCGVPSDDEPSAPDAARGG
jgi:hypothetical protein